MELRKGMEGQFNMSILARNVETKVKALEKKVSGFEFTPEADKDMGRLEAFREVLECLGWYQSNVHKLPQL